MNLTRQVFHWKDVIMQLWQLSKISRYHVREPYLPFNIKKSVCPHFKFGNWCPVFCTWYEGEYGGTKMAYIRSAVNINVLQIYLTSDVLSLCSSQPLARKHTKTNTVKDLPRSGRPHVTSQCEDRALHRLVRRMPFANSPVIKKQGLPNRRYQQEQLGTVWND